MGLNIPHGRKHVVIHGNCNYKQTGMLQAYAAYHLTQQAPSRVGFACGIGYTSRP